MDVYEVDIIVICSMMYLPYINKKDYQEDDDDDDDDMGVPPPSTT